MLDAFDGEPATGTGFGTIHASAFGHTGYCYKLGPISERACYHFAYLQMLEYHMQRGLRVKGAADVFLVPASGQKDNDQSSVLWAPGCAMRFHC